MTKSVCLPLAMALLLAACATTVHVPATPEDTVQRFCRLDFEGARLSSDTYHRIDPLVTWKEQVDMDPVYLVRGYEVGGSKIEGDRAEVPVKYDLISRLDVPWHPGHPDLAADLAANAEVVFRLVRHRGAWKIDGPAITPHASPEALARVIRSWPQTGYNGYDERLRGTLEYLDSLSGR